MDLIDADVARFSPSDPEELVRASLACPVCLRGERVLREDRLRGYDPHVSCECPECDSTWRVYLSPEQALRLGLMHAHV